MLRAAETFSLRRLRCTAAAVPCRCTTAPSDTAESVAQRLHRGRVRNEGPRRITYSANRLTTGRLNPTFSPQDRIGRLTMRNLDMADRRKKLAAFARVGLLHRAPAACRAPTRRTPPDDAASAHRRRIPLPALSLLPARRHRRPASWVPRGGADRPALGRRRVLHPRHLSRGGDGYRIRSEPGGLPSSLHPPLVPAFVSLHELALQTTDPIVVGRALKVSLALCSAAYVTAAFLLLSASLPLRSPPASRWSRCCSRSMSSSREPSSPKRCSASGALLRRAQMAARRPWVRPLRRLRGPRLRGEDRGHRPARSLGGRSRASEGRRRALVALAVSAVVVTSWNG